MKKIISLLLILTFGLSLSACSKGDISFDIDELAVDLLSNVEFSDELTSVSDDIIKNLYEIDNAVKQSVYIGSGATAEEIALFEFENTSDADSALVKVKKRLETQEKAFEDYIPEEIPKLQSAVLKINGKYLVLCVSGNGKAEEIIDKYIK